MAVDEREEGGGVATIATVTRRAAERLRAGHLWVYKSDVQGFSGSPGTVGGRAGEPAGGDLVTVVDGRGLALGTALYSSGSQISLRMVSATAGLTRLDYLDEVRRRVLAAVALRDELVPVSDGNNGRRLVFGEADGLPGIVVDQYGNIGLAQFLVQGTAREDVRAAAGAALAEVFPEGTVWERTDARIREIEGLGMGSAEPLWVGGGVVREETIFALNGLRFHYSAGAGQKTGAFLDQRLNYSAAAVYAKGRALDVCTYQGGFALHLARGCERVTGVDASRSALEVADRNLDLNRGLLRAEVDWIEADAFELMRAYEEAGERFGTVVLDPPAFAKSKRAADGALRGYKELNLMALRMLEKGGILVTCSCSHHVAVEEFTDVVGAAAADAGKRVQVIESRGAAPDHPVVLNLPETSYLKCLICRVL